MKPEDLKKALQEKYDIDRCPYCNRKVNTDKLPIRYATNEKNEIKPIIVVGNEYRVWGGIAGEQYKFGSIPLSFFLIPPCHLLFYPK